MLVDHLHDVVILLVQFAQCSQLILQVLDSFKIAVQQSKLFQGEELVV